MYQEDNYVSRLKETIFVVEKIDVIENEYLLKS